MIRWCARVIDERWFNTTAALVIVTNALVLGIETYPGAVSRFGFFLEMIDTACLGYFIVELAIRIVACGRRPADFFRNPWNIFDLIVILLAVLPGVRENATLLRLVRLARGFRGWLGGGGEVFSPCFFGLVFVRHQRLPPEVKKAERDRKGGGWLPYPFRTVSAGKSG